MSESTNIQESMIDDHFIESIMQGHPHDIAAQIQYLNTDVLREILRRLPDETAAEVISELPDERQIDLFEAMRINRLSGIISEMFTDDVADVLGKVSTERLRLILTSLPKEEASRITDLLKYPEDSAGGIMQTEFISISEDMTLEEARESLRRDQEEDFEGAYYLYVIDEIGRLTGVLRMRDLLFRPPGMSVSKVMVRAVRCVSVHADQERIAELAQNYHYLAVPVIDDFGKLVGVVTNDDLIDVIQEEATEDMQLLAGLSGEEGVLSAWHQSVRRRLPWLYINLAMAFVAAAVVSLYEETIAQYAVLAVFLPVIAGLSGNTGTQVLTIMVRSLALGEIDVADRWRLLRKELLVGVINGIAIGIGVSLLCWIWKGNPVLGIIILVAMVVNMACAALAGVLVPLGLKAFKVDPALASSIIVTTIVDVFGFFVFLALATAFIEYISP
ncbi:MAG: magnesium transporter [Verrucomicrobiota bacterium]